MRCEFLLPYSPDYNPIELAFSAMKLHLRRNGDYIRLAMTHMSAEDVHLRLLRSLYSVTHLENVHGWFGHCGYV